MLFYRIGLSMRQLRTEVYNLHDDIAICQKRLVTDENKIKVMGSRWARDKRTLMCFRYYFLKGIVEDAITEYKSWCATECSLYSDVRRPYAAVLRSFIFKDWQFIFKDICTDTPEYECVVSLRCWEAIAVERQALDLRMHISVQKCIIWQML